MQWLLGTTAGALLGFIVGVVGCGVHNQSNFFQRTENVTVYVLGVAVHHENGTAGTATAVGGRWLPPLVGAFTACGLLAGLTVVAFRSRQPAITPG